MASSNRPCLPKATPRLLWALASCGLSFRASSYWVISSVQRALQLIDGVVQLTFPGQRGSKIIMGQPVVLRDRDGVSEDRLAVLPMINLAARKTDAEQRHHGGSNRQRGARATPASRQLMRAP